MNNTILDIKISEHEIYRINLKANQPLQQQIHNFCQDQNILEYENKILNSFMKLFNLNFLSRLDDQKNKSQQKQEKRKQNKIFKELKECTFKPKILKSQQNPNLTPIRNKKHELCKQQNDSINSFSPKINNYSINVSPFKERINEKQLFTKNHEERHEKQEKKKKQSKTVIIRLENNNRVQYEHQKEVVQFKGIFKSGVDSQDDLNSVQEQILEKNQKVDEGEYKILKQLFREILCVSQNRYRLQISSIDYSMIDQLHIEILDRFVQFYQLNINLLISEDQFILLMIHSKILHQNMQEKEQKEKARIFVNQESVPKHYCKYLQIDQ